MPKRLCTSMRNDQKRASGHSVTLRRGDRTPVTNLLSSLGPVKETHLSAMLGYLFHLNPESVDLLFGIQGPFESVALEPRSENGFDRYDIVITNSKGEHVVEVKIDGHEPSQIARYAKSQKSIYTIGSRFRGHVVKAVGQKCFSDWQDVATALTRSKSRGRAEDAYFNRLVDDFIVHLRECYPQN